jgi:hypothetical protein
MRSDLAVSLVVGVLLILLVLLPRWLWRHGKVALAPTKPTRAQRQPKPFAGLTRRPECEMCDQGVESQLQGQFRTSVNGRVSSWGSLAAPTRMPLVPRNAEAERCSTIYLNEHAPWLSAFRRHGLFLAEQAPVV